jgi:WD40 repeat protein
MSDSFDPYYTWLGIPPDEQPPNHYRLLGVRDFEDHADVIANAADRQMTHVRTFQSGKNSKHSQQILNELAKAKVCLLSPDKKQHYDEVLRAKDAAAKRPPAKPAAAAPIKRAAEIKQPEPAFNFEPATPVRAARVGSSSKSKLPVSVIAALAVGLVLIVVIAAALVLGGRGNDDDPNLVGGTDAGPLTVGTTGNDGGNADGNTDGGTTSGNLTTDGGSTDGGSTDGGSTDGGSTDGSSTDGGSTDGGSTDGGSTDGGGTDGGGTDGDETQPPAPVPAIRPRADGSIDLISLIDSAKYAISGNWTRQGPFLRCDEGPSALCAIPFEPKGAYELEFDVRRLVPAGVIQIHLPVGGSAVTLGLHGKRSDGRFVAGLALSGGTSPGTAATVVDPPVADVVHRVRVKVTPQDKNATITVDMDGRQIAFWTGSQTMLSSRMKDLPNPRHIVVGGYAAAVEFQSIRLLDKSAPAVSPPAAPSIAATGAVKRFNLMAETAVHNSRSPALCFSPDSRLLVTVSHDKTVRTWDVVGGLTERKVQTLEGMGFTSCVDFSPDGKHVVTGEQQEFVRLWDVDAKDKSRVLGQLPKYWVASIQFANKGRTVMSAFNEQIIFWDVATGEKQKTIKLPYWLQGGGAVLAPDEASLATAPPRGFSSSNHDIILWDLATGTPRWSATLETEGVNWLAFSPDGAVLAAARSAEIQLRNATDGQLIASLDVGEHPAQCIAFSPDGSILAVGTEGKVMIWDMRARKHVAVLQTSSEGGFTSIAFSPDGKRLAGGKFWGQLLLWEVEFITPRSAPAPDQGVVRIEAEAMQPVGGKSDVEGDFVRLMQLQSAREFTFDVPQDGEYTFRVRAYGKQTGNEPAKMSYIFDGKLIHTFDVTVVAQRPKRYSLSVNGIRQGRHTFRIQFANDIYISPTQDRDLFIDYLEIVPPPGVSIVAPNAVPVAPIDAPPAKREAVPELAAQEEALKQVRDLFQDEYAAAKTDAAKVELAQTLAKTSGDSKAPAVERYVLLSEASRLAVEGARADVAMVIIDAIGRSFETDTIQLKADALNESLKHMRLDDQRKQLADLAWTASGAALDAKQFDACGSLLKTVLSCVARPRDDDARELRKNAVLRLRELQTLTQQADNEDQG